MRTRAAQLQGIGSAARAASHRRIAGQRLWFPEASRVLCYAIALGLVCACMDDEARVAAAGPGFQASAVLEVRSSDISAGLAVDGLMNLGEIELGRVPLDGLRCRFHVRNLTGEKLERVRLVPTCGCTQAIATQESITPGETLSVDLRLSPRVAGEQSSEVGVLATPSGREEHRTDAYQEPRERPVARMRIAWTAAARFRLAVDAIAVESNEAQSTEPSVAVNPAPSARKAMSTAQLRVVATAPSSSSSPPPLMVQALSPLAQDFDSVRILRQSVWQAVCTSDGSIAPGVWTTDAVLELRPPWRAQPPSLAKGDSVPSSHVVVLSIGLAGDGASDGLGSTVLTRVELSDAKIRTEEMSSMK